MTYNDTLLNFFKMNDTSQKNQEVALDYIADLADVGKGLSEYTINNNVRIIIFILKCIETDLDKLTKEDIKRYKRFVETYTYTKQCPGQCPGKSVSKATKKYYLVGFKQFLKWALKEFDNPNYRELIDSISTTMRVDEKNASDMLTDEEINALFRAAKEPRDLALLSVLAEAGCRVGELVSMQIRHVKFTDEFVWVTLPKSKTRPRALPLKESMTYLANWLSHHPLKDDETAPLWISLNKLPSKKGDSDRAYQKMKTNSVLELIHRLATRAGIKKRCYPHLLRHTAATKLSKEWTEPRMRNYFGWSSHSAMPSVYSHLGAGDLEDAVRERYGTAEERRPEPKFQKCPRCKRELPRRAEYCDVCGTKLGEQQLQKVDEAVVAAMRKVILEENPELLQKVAEVMLKAQK